MRRLPLVLEFSLRHQPRIGQPESSIDGNRLLKAISDQGGILKRFDEETMTQFKVVQDAQKAHFDATRSDMLTIYHAIGELKKKMDRPKLQLSRPHQTPARSRVIVSVRSKRNPTTLKLKLRLLNGDEKKTTRRSLD
ncbi:MAG: hypothetical protein Q9180_000794 [Flavoplaca navasiana]